MPAQLTITGKDIVVDERDLTIVFKFTASTGLDWSNAGYTAVFFYKTPSGTSDYKILSSVSGDVYSAQLVGTADCFPEAGTYRGEVVFIDGTHPINLGTVVFTFDVYPNIASPIVLGGQNT